jgi:ribonuclease T1
MGRRAIAPLTARFLLALLLGALGLALAPGRVEARSHHHRAKTSAASDSHGSGLTDPAERAEIKQMLDRIAANGPFKHRQDGVVFGNREGRLPAKPRGYYHEYTVETPGASDRGARRIIRGQGGETYYTHDHYQSFQRLDPGTFR